MQCGHQQKPVCTPPIVNVSVASCLYHKDSATERRTSSSGHAFAHTSDLPLTWRSCRIHPDRSCRVVSDECLAKHQPQPNCSACLSYHDNATLTRACVLVFWLFIFTLTFSFFFFRLSDRTAGSRRAQLSMQTERKTLVAKSRSCAITSAQIYPGQQAGERVSKRSLLCGPHTRTNSALPCESWYLTCRAAREPPAIYLYIPRLCRWQGRHRNYNNNNTTAWSAVRRRPMGEWSSRWYRGDLWAAFCALSGY